MRHSRRAGPRPRSNPACTRIHVVERISIRYACTGWIKISTASITYMGGVDADDDVALVLEGRDLLLVQGRLVDLVGNLNLGHRAGRLLERHVHKIHVEPEEVVHPSVVPVLAGRLQLRQHVEQGRVQVDGVRKADQHLEEAVAQAGVREALFLQIHQVRVARARGVHPHVLDVAEVGTEPLRLRGHHGCRLHRWWS